MPKYLKTHHDCGILRSDTSTKVGLMLVEDRGKPLYRTLTERYLKNQYYAGAPDYGALDPQSEIAIILDDFRAGLGLEVADSAQPERYNSSIGMDMRHRGMAVAGNTPTAITLPAVTAVSITNADFELNANWTTGAGTFAQAGGVSLSGDFSWEGSIAGYAFQDLTWNANHVGHTFKFLCWVKCSAASDAKIGIDSGTEGVKYSDYHTGGGGWEQLSVSKTLGSTADKLSLRLTTDTNGNGDFDDAEIWQPNTDAVQAFHEFNDNQYISRGNELYKLNKSTGNTLTSIAIFPTNIVRLTHFKYHLVICIDQGIIIEDCEDPWVQGDAAVTCSTDSGDYIVGSGSAKNVVGADLAVNTLIATEDFSAINISSADGIEFWIKSSIDVAATKLELYLDNEAACASPSEEISLPALVADRWTLVHVDLSDKESATAIISVGLFQDITDLGAFTLWIDDVKLAYKYWLMTTGETFIQSTLSNAYFDFMAVVHGTSPTLYGAHRPNELRKATDASNAGSWGTVTEIGSPIHDATDLLEWRGLAHIMKETQPHYIDSSDDDQSDLAPECRSERATTSGKNAFVWYNKLYIPCGTQSLLETDATTNTWRNPASYCTNLSDFVGRIQALAGDSQYLYAIVDNGNKLEVLAGRLEVIGSAAVWVWHPIAEIPAFFNGCETAYVSNVYQKRIWVSQTGAGVLHFTGEATSNVNIGDKKDGNKLWMSFWFKLDTAVATGGSGTDQYLMGKYKDADELLTVHIEGSDGKIYLIHNEGGGAETISTAETAWTLGWHHVLASCSTVVGQRLIVDGVTAVTDTDNKTAISLTANHFVFGNRDDGTCTTGLIGEMREIVFGIDDLTTAEEAGLYAGTLPGDETEYWPMDEGSGTTIEDNEGTSDADGTADSACYWEGDFLYYLPIPATYGNITCDVNRLFKDGAYFITPWQHGNFKGEDKRWIKVTATLGHTYNANVYFELHYQKKGDTSWTYAEDFKGTDPASGGTMVHTLYLPDDSGDNSPISPMMRFKLVAKTNDTSITPVLLSLDIRAILRPPSRKIIECVIRVKDGILDRKGHPLAGTNAAYIREVLDEARDASDVFTFYDPWGAAKNCIMLPADPESDIIESLKNENPEQLYHLRMQIVALS